MKSTGVVVNIGWMIMGTVEERGGAVRWKEPEGG